MGRVTEKEVKCKWGCGGENKKTALF